MITADYLKDWMMDNGEDVVADGPYDISVEQWDALGVNVKAKLEKEFNTTLEGEPEDWYESVWDNEVLQSSDNDKVMDMILDVMAKFINEENIQEF